MNKTDKITGDYIVAQLADSLINVELTTENLNAIIQMAEKKKQMLDDKYKANKIKDDTRIWINNNEPKHRESIREYNQKYYGAFTDSLTRLIRKDLNDLIIECMKIKNKEAKHAKIKGGMRYWKIKEIRSDNAPERLIKFKKPETKIDDTSDRVIKFKKTEAKIEKYLLSTNIPYIREARFEWCRYKNSLPFDFCIPDSKFIIECDGAGHFEQVLNWEDPLERQSKDILKMIKANLYEYSIIRVIQDEIWTDKYLWQDEISRLINQQSSIPTNTIIQRCNRYDYSYVIDYNDHYQSCYDEYMVDHHNLAILEKQLMDYWYTNHEKPLHDKKLFNTIKKTILKSIIKLNTILL
jgi:very-short-patch-repair endonuclease